MARPRTVKEEAPSGVTAESIMAELEAFDLKEPEGSTYMVDVHGHRLESEAYVRAFAWARKRGNELKACLVFADAHELSFENSDTPVVKRD